jgi:uncharacterized protein (TIGR03067 family)
MAFGEESDDSLTRRFGMRMHVVIAVAFLLNQVPATVVAEDQQKGLEQLKGSWEVTKSEPEFSPKRLVFDGNKLTIVFGEEEKKETKIRIDVSAKPAQIDIDPDKENSLGIYEVSGDTLRICFATTKGGKRPTEFKASEGVILVTLKREKK